MSTTKQKADLEAAAVEHELTDEEVAQLREAVEAGAAVKDSLQLVLAAREASDDADLTDASAGDAETGDPTPKQLRALDAETERHLAEVRQIMGHFVEGFEPCEWCGSVGLMPPSAPRPHDNFRPCATCNGHGEVLTGSKRDGYTARQCPDCRGRGYLERMLNGSPVSPDGPPIANETTPPPAALAPQPVPVPVNGDGGGDEFGVPAWMGDPTLGQ